MAAAHDSPLADLGTNLSSTRTGMAFQRTRLAADRTLMAVIRTSLSLISFGFTIYKLLDSLQATQVGGAALNDHAARNFGITLCAIGVVALLAGIVYHVWFMRDLRNKRNAMDAAGTLATDDGFPTHATLVVAVMVLLVGIFAIVSIAFKVGPFI
jgi:putative membrane protein